MYVPDTMALLETDEQSRRGDLRLLPEGEVALNKIIPIFEERKYTSLDNICWVEGSISITF